MRKIALIAFLSCSCWAACAPASMHLSQIAQLALSCENIQDQGSRNSCEANIYKDIAALRANFNEAKDECALLRDIML